MGQSKRIYIVGCSLKQLWIGLGKSGNFKNRSRLHTVWEQTLFFSERAYHVCNLISIRLKWLCPILGTKSFHNVSDPICLQLCSQPPCWPPKTFPLKISWSLSSILYQRTDSQIWLSWSHAVPITDRQNRFRSEDYVSVYSTEEKKKVKDPLRNGES